MNRRAEGDAVGEIGNSAATVKTPSKIRVWTQFAQHLNAKIYSIDRKAVAVFLNLVASLRMSFILQKKRSTMLRLA